MPTTSLLQTCYSCLYPTVNITALLDASYILLITHHILLFTPKFHKPTVMVPDFMAHAHNFTSANLLFMSISNKYNSKHYCTPRCLIHPSNNSPKFRNFNHKPTVMVPDFVAHAHNLSLWAYCHRIRHHYCFIE